jgi:hypothetical protein
LEQAAGAAGNTTTASSGARSLLRRDELTGESYLHIPVPQPKVLEQALKAMSTLLESMRK